MNVFYLFFVSFLFLKLNARELCKLAGVEGVAGAEADTATPLPLIQLACILLAAKIPDLGTKSMTL